MTPDQLEALTRQVAEQLEDFAKEVGATSARLADDCTACGEIFTGARRVGTLSLSLLQGHRVLHFVCRECLAELTRDFNAVASRIEARLTTELHLGEGIPA